MSRTGETRRLLLAWLGAGALLPRPGTAAPAKRRDIGIGGTGFIGTIQRFGSIFVNDRRITYAADVPLHIDGERRGVRDLKVGHVVRLVARPDADRLVTAAIAVEREVVGPIIAVSEDSLNVLGQTVALGTVQPQRRWRKGERVAVSGLRRTDGTIVASLIERLGAGPSRVAGVLERDAGGFWIAGLKLLRAEEAWLGRRVVVTGRIVKGGFQPSHAAPAPLIGQEAGVTAISIETYVRATAGGLLFGAGAPDREIALPSALPPGQEVRVVLDGRLGTDGGLTVETLHSPSHVNDKAGRGPAAPGKPGGVGRAAPDAAARPGMDGWGASPDTQGPGGPGGPAPR